MRIWITGFSAALVLALCAAPAAARSAQTDAAMQAAFEAARRVSPVPLSLDREQAEWLEYGDRSPEGAAERIEDLQRRAGQDRAAWDLRVTVDDLSQGCLPIVLRGCRTVSGGYVTREDGPALYWQIQRGFTEYDGVSGGFVLLTQDADGMLRPAAWDFAGFDYETPEWVEGAGTEDAAFIAAPGRHDGTGAHNADVVFRIAEGAERPLVQIDNFSWRDGLDARLPRGLEVWKGVRFLYGGLMAQTSLWRSNDANCCPTGGEAYLDFEMRDDRMVLTGVQANDALSVQATAVPAEVFAWVGRRMNCAHWMGEEPYDAERAAEIRAAVARGRCDALEADLEALNREYADREAILDMLARAEGS